MKNSAIFTIFKKEVFRFIKDRRTLIALIMPGILIYALYSLMGGALNDAFMPDDDYKPQVVAVNLPNSFSQLLSEDVVALTSATQDEVESIKELIVNDERDLLMIFPDNFDESIAAGASTPNVDVFYDSSSTNSSMAYQTIVALLDAYEASISNVFNVNMGGGTYDLATEEDVTGMVFSMMMPMLLMMLLFSGCMAVAPESIAGEKERGTIATMLITPTKRSHLAIGKILALSLMALISGASSTLGVLLSLPRLMGSEMQLDGSVYGVTDYVMLTVVILSTVMLFITLISVISAYAKTIKEATTYVTPLMVLSMLIGLSGMMGTVAENSLLYLLPIFNSVHSMIGIFSFEASVVNVAITVAVNLTVTGIGIFVLTRMFNSEKIMFNK